MVLLDTCTFIWMLQGGEELSEVAKEKIYRPDTRLSISTISACEIGIKQAKGDLELPEHQLGEQWFARAATDLEVEVGEVTAEIAWLSTQFPWHHKDPFDRIILATARSLKCPVATPDRHFDLYDNITRLW